MNSPLARNFNLISLLQYTFPSILMMVFMSTYTIIDGIFISAYVGEAALAATNLVMPLIGIVMAISLMFATGGNAIIARFLGQGKKREASEFLTVLYIIGAILGVIMTFIMVLFPDEILVLMNVSESLYAYARNYLLSMVGFIIPLFFMVFIQSFMVTAGHPTFGLILSLAGGFTNIILDYIFISPDILNLGIVGAGLATGIGYTVPGLIGLFYFLCNRKCIIHFVKPKLNVRLIGQSMFNGSSELVGSLATSITTIMFNVILLNMVGDAGVAAISVILYLQMFQSAIYMGYTMGASSIIAYKYGEENHKGLHKIVMQSFKIITIASILVVAITLLFQDQAISIFIEKESGTFAMAKQGLLLFLPAYLFMGFNVFFSALFTALSNGKVSATISVLRTLVFIVIALLTLPRILGLNGVWLALPLAEFLAIIVSFYLYKRYKKVYHY